MITYQINRKDLKLKNWPLLILGDSYNNHISPELYSEESPTGEYFMEHQILPKVLIPMVQEKTWSYDERYVCKYKLNEIVPGTEEDLQNYFLRKSYASLRRFVEYKRTDLIVMGEEYGTGSSRDWALKAKLLGSSCAEVWEIQVNLVGMESCLQFVDGMNRINLKFEGSELITLNIEKVWSLKSELS